MTQHLSERSALRPPLDKKAEALRLVVRQGAAGLRDEAGTIEAEDMTEDERGVEPSAIDPRQRQARGRRRQCLADVEAAAGARGAQPSASISARRLAWSSAIRASISSSSASPATTRSSL
jgi:hypothetical protein